MTSIDVTQFAIQADPSFTNSQTGPGRPTTLTWTGR